MDITTLAAANAYTDKKVGAGGGSGGGGLPVVELTTAPSTEGDGAALTAEENALVDAAISNGTPFVVNFPITQDGMTFKWSLIFAGYSIEMDGVIMGQYMSGNYTIQGEFGEWYFEGA